MPGNTHRYTGCANACLIWLVRYGKIIITEYSLPTAMKSIKPFQPDKEVTQLTEKEEERLAALKRLYKKAELADKVAARGYHDANRAPACILQCACVCVRACAHACVRLRACVRAYVSVRVPASQAKRAALGVLGRRGLQPLWIQLHRRESQEVCG